MGAAARLPLRVSRRRSFPLPLPLARRDTPTRKLPPDFPVCAPPTDNTPHRAPQSAGEPRLRLRFRVALFPGGESPQRPSTGWGRGGNSRAAALEGSPRSRPRPRPPRGARKSQSGGGVEPRSSDTAPQARAHWPSLLSSSSSSSAPQAGGARREALHPRSAAPSRSGAGSSGRAGGGGARGGRGGGPSGQNGAARPFSPPGRTDRRCQGRDRPPGARTEGPGRRCSGRRAGFTSGRAPPLLPLTGSAGRHYRAGASSRRTAAAAASSQRPARAPVVRRTHPRTPGPRPLPADAPSHWPRARPRVARGRSAPAGSSERPVERGSSREGMGARSGRHAPLGPCPPAFPPPHAPARTDSSSVALPLRPYMGRARLLRVPRI